MGKNATLVHWRIGVSVLARDLSLGWLSALLLRRAASVPLLLPKVRLIKNLLLATKSAHQAKEIERKGRWQ